MPNSKSAAFPNAWEIEAHEVDADQDESDDEVDEDEHKEGTLNCAQQTQSPNGHVESHAYKEFLQFLELGCYGSALQGYPTIIIIMSTIPTSVGFNLASSAFHLILRHGIDFDFHRFCFTREGSFCVILGRP